MADPFQNLPNIQDSGICFTRCIMLPNFVIDSVKKEYAGVLTSKEGYAQYYKANEKKKGSAGGPIVSIQFSNSALEMLPLKSKITLNTYWKSFRVPIMKGERVGQPTLELFQLLPLKIEIPITSVKANQIYPDFNLYVYLFPFGACCANMELKVRNVTFKELI